MGKKRFRTSSIGLRRILAENICTYRKIKQISQEELADLCDIHRTYVGSVERGERNVTLSTLEIFATVLNVEVSRLLTKEAFKDGI